MITSSTGSRYPSWIAQVALVSLMSASLTLIVDHLHFLSLWNGFWIVLAPAAIGVVLNAGAARRAGMVLLLPAVSTVSLMITGQLFGSMG